MSSRNGLDKLSSIILAALNQADEPLDTKEIEDRVTVFTNDVTRIKLVLRLHNLRGENLIRGKSLGSGRGAWVWWRIPKNAANSANGVSNHGIYAQSEQLGGKAS
jgi:predicted RNA-binding protein YlxR (DUF448 family)